MMTHRGRESKIKLLCEPENQGLLPQNHWALRRWIRQGDNQNPN